VALASEGPAGSCPARTRAITEMVCDPSTLLGTSGQSLVLVRCRTDPRSTENEKPRVVLDLSGAGVAVRLGVADAVRCGVASAPAVADGEAPGVGDAATSVNIATAAPASASANGILDFKIGPPSWPAANPTGSQTVFNRYHATRQWARRRGRASSGVSTNDSGPCRSLSRLTIPNLPGQAGMTGSIG
jgi:hypothetical protein